MLGLCPPKQIMFRICFRGKGKEAYYSTLNGSLFPKTNPVPHLFERKEAYYSTLKAFFGPSEALHMIYFGGKRPDTSDSRGYFWRPEYGCTYLS